MQLSEWFIGRDVVPFREEEIAQFNKELKKKEEIRVFRRENTIFRRWEVDNTNTLGDCLDYDSAQWKLRDIDSVQKQEPYQEVFEVLISCMVELKSVWTNL